MNSMTHVAPTGRASRLAHWLALGCAIHCLAMPLVAAVLPVVGLGFMANENAETVLIAGALVLGAATLWHGWRFHRQRRPAALWLAALGLFAIAKLVSEGAAETALSVAGALALAAAQFVDRRCCRHCCAGADRLEVDGHKTDTAARPSQAD